MVVVGPMLATLMTMSNGGHLPLSCDMDAHGVTIQLGSRVQFFVELPKVSVPDACDECDRAGSADLSAVLNAAVDDANSMQALAWQDKLDADEAALADGEVAQADETAQSDELAQANETDEPAIDALEGADYGQAQLSDAEEDVTYQQIAALDGADFDADAQAENEDAPLAGVSSASAADEAPADDAPLAGLSSASAEDQASAEDDQPVASDADATQELPPSSDSAAVDTDSATGPSSPNLLFNVRQTWLQRFAWVRNEVRTVFH